MLNIKTILWIKKDKKNRSVYIKYEIKKLILKSLLYNQNNNFFKKFYFDFYFKKFPFKSSIAKYRTSCMFLGNNRSIITKFKLSRDLCKKYGAAGYLNGLKKSSF